MFKQEKKYYRNAFLYGLIMAAVLFLPFVLIDRGYFIFYGDYNAQQIPFFKHCVEMVHNGTMGWDWNTDIGANFFGSYTYYTLGSPFFWFMTLFPASWSQYLMAPLLCVKFGVISLLAFAYVRRFVSKPQTALIGGILYAFSAFNLYNVFFQFQDAFMWFPLLLIGLEEAVVNKRRGVFALTVALNALANYFFFISSVVFLVIYFLCRYAMDKRFSIKLRDFLCLAAESVMGVLIAGVLFVPSIYQVLDVPRSHSVLTDWNFLFFGNEQRYGLLLESMFFPPEIAARNNMFTEANAKWSSVALYLPLFSMAGVIAFLKGAKRHWARALIPICVIMAFIPGLNSLFTMMNSNYYTRWFYAPELIMCLATVYTLEHSEFDLKFGWKVCTWTVAAMSVLALLSPFTKDVENETGEKVKTVLPRIFRNVDKSTTEKDVMTLVPIILAAVFLVILYFVIKMRGKIPQSVFFRRVTAVTVVCSMGLGYYFFIYGRLIGPSKIGRFNQQVESKFEIDDPDFYRIEGLNETNNFAMFSGGSSLKSFTSIIPGSTFELYDLIGENRTVNSAPPNSRYAFRAFSRVKYIMIPSDMNRDSRNNAIKDLSIYNYMDTQGEYDIYKTDYALPMGFAYDEYFLVDDVKDNKKVDNIMVRAAILTPEQAEKYSGILETGDPDDTGVISLDRFKKDALERIEAGVKQFSITKKGFTARCDYNSDKLVVFSVPFCKGWEASVNGKPVEVDKINAGLCGIRVPSGECNIEFTYHTPGLRSGIFATFAGIAALAIYLIYFLRLKRVKVNGNVHLYDKECMLRVGAHCSYIEQTSSQIATCPERSPGSSQNTIIFSGIDPVENDKNDR